MGFDGLVGFLPSAERALFLEFVVGGYGVVFMFFVGGRR